MESIVETVALMKLKEDTVGRERSIRKERRSGKEEEKRDRGRRVFFYRRPVEASAPLIKPYTPVT